MLEIRPCCEHCGKDLPNDSTEAMICTFECTYCEDCAMGVFENVCPSCDGNFTKRPIRPKRHLDSNPPATERLHKPKDLEQASKNTQKYRNIPPEKR